MYVLNQEESCGDQEALRNFFWKYHFLNIIFFPFFILVKQSLP